MPIRIVHRAVNVGHAVEAGALVLHGACRVVGLYPAVGFLEIRTISGLVAQRPHYNRRMVAQLLHMALISLQMGCGVSRVFGEGALLITHAMAFDVGFGGNIYAVTVAEVVPARVVGIVRRTHRIDVMLLHQLYILQHTLGTNHIAAVGVEFMPIDTFDKHRLSVYQQTRALDLHAAETYVERNHFLHLAATAQGSCKAIEVRSFGSPLLRIGDFKGFSHLAPGIINLGLGHCFA